jgi:ABC-type transport system substrate-binding protein
MQQDMIATYRKGGLDLVDGLEADDPPLTRGIPAREKITSPDALFVEYFFNQRSTAPNAAANGGTSLFTDPAVRKAFVQAFDRCAAVRALLSLPNCADPSLFTDELTSPPSPDYDSTFKLPPFDPAAAAAALDRARYPVVDGIRRAKDGKTPLQLVLAVHGLADSYYPLAVRMQQDWQRILHVRVTLHRYVLSPAPNSPYGGGAVDVWLDVASITMDPTDSLLAQGGGWDRADIPSPQNPTGQNVFGLIDPYVVDRSQLGSQIQDEGQRDTL